MSSTYGENLKLSIFGQSHGSGIGMTLENSFIVELGILLDVLALVFIMGIAVSHINREFAHIDTDRLNHLGDWSAQEPELKTEQDEEE